MEKFISYSSNVILGKIMEEKNGFLVCMGIIVTLVIILCLNSVLAQNSQESGKEICAVYITGIGCPNCAITDSAILFEYTKEYPNLIVIEYEIYHLRASNQKIADKYFQNYIPNTRAGVPLIIFNKNKVELGRFQVLDSKEIIRSLDSNSYSLPDGSSVDFKDLDLTSLQGKVKIWTKNRILISGIGGNNDLLKKLLTVENISSFLEDVEFEWIEPEPIPISDAQIEFTNAIKIGNWILEWNGESSVITTGKTDINDITGINHVTKSHWKHWYWILIGFGFFLVLFALYKLKVLKKCMCICLTEKQKNYLIIGISLFLLLGFFILAKNIPHESLEKLGYGLPLPIFTVFIALIDGFNPCNLFVLTFLLGLLISASHSRKKIFAVGYTFISVVFIIYFLFMAAWLNIFKYIGFITPLRIGIACIALIAGIINCKEFFFYRKGITLMIQEQHIGPLKRRVEHMKDIIVNGSMPALILASISLATFASLVELPCTAGFPIIYTGILTGRVLATSISYYAYLLLYALIYVIPLIVVITIFGYTFKGKQISKRQMQIIKFIGGLIMILLGIILLINPSLIGIGFS